MESDAVDVWGVLIAQAIASAGLGARECCVNWLPTPFYADYEHVNEAEHVCRECDPYDSPRYLVTVQTLQTVPREVLVERLSSWLKHVHSYQDDDQNPAVRSGGAAVDAPGSAGGACAPSAGSDSPAAIATDSGSGVAGLMADAADLADCCD